MSDRVEKHRAVMQVMLFVHVGAPDLFEHRAVVRIMHFVQGTDREDVSPAELFHEFIRFVSAGAATRLATFSLQALQNDATQARATGKAATLIPDL